MRSHRAALQSQFVFRLGVPVFSPVVTRYPHHQNLSKRVLSAASSQTPRKMSSSGSPLPYVIAALGGAAVGAAVVQLLSRSASPASRPVLQAPTRSNHKQRSERRELPPHIEEEVFSRVQSFFGEDAFRRLRGSFVVVVGIGGVGSHAIHMLVRSGVKRIRIIDFDQVSLSSLNRHAVATMADVGHSKAAVMRDRLLEIVPDAEIEAIESLFCFEEADRLLAGNPDFVLDCIDDVNTKAELLAYCKKNNLRVLTSMGAACKADPTKLRIGTLKDCVRDPLAQKIRWKLNKHEVNSEDIQTVFSVEKPRMSLLPLTEEQKQDPAAFGALENFRVRVLPVLGTSPAIFGQAMASFVLCELAEQPYLPDSCEHMSKNLKHKLLQFLKNNEQAMGFNPKDVDLEYDDIEFVSAQIWKSACAVSGRKIGGHKSMHLVRWNRDEPLTLYNIVLVTQENAAKIIEDKFQLGQEVIDRIEHRLRWARVLLED